MNETMLSEVLRDWSDIANDQLHDGISVALLAVPDSDVWVVGSAEGGNPGFVGLYGDRGLWLTCGEGVDMVTSVFSAGNIRSGVKDALSPAHGGSHVNHLRTWTFWLDGPGAITVESQRRTINGQAIRDPSIRWWEDPREVRCQLLAGLAVDRG